MATTEELLSEVESIWRATLRAERRRRIEATIIGLAGIASGVSLFLELGHIYTSMAGLN